MRGVDSLAQNLRDVEIRGAGDEGGHHESYRQYDLGPAAHMTERSPRVPLAIELTRKK